MSFDVIGLLGGVRATIFATLCVALGATAAVQSWRLGNAQEEVARFGKAVETFQTAQAINLGTIDELRETNAQWARKCMVDPAATSKASQDTEQDNGALPVDDQRRADEREKVYGSDVEAKEWGRGRVPGRLVDRLRK